MSGRGRARTVEARAGDGLRIVLSHVYSWPEVRRGGERYLHEVASALKDAGHSVAVLSTSRRPGRGRVLGVPVTYLPRRALMPRRTGECAEEIAFGLQAAGRVAGRSVDVWHALGTADAAAAGALSPLKGARSVYTSLGIPTRAYRDSRPDRRLHDHVVRRVDGYVCLSRAAASALRSGWGREGTVIGGGVDLRRFSPGPRHDRPVLLYAGALDEPRKNVALLIEAVGTLRARWPEVELWISGIGDLGALMERASPAGRQAVVDVGVGTEEEHVARYARAWATVLPSYDEAFGLCLLESLASGTPIVVLADSGGPAEIVRPDVGVAAGPSAAELADACEQALQLALTGGTAEACRAEAERYDWRRSIVPQLERVYRAEPARVAGPVAASEPAGTG